MIPDATNRKSGPFPQTSLDSFEPPLGSCKELSLGQRWSACPRTRRHDHHRRAPKIGQIYCPPSARNAEGGRCASVMRLNLVFAATSTTSGAAQERRQSECCAALTSAAGRSSSPHPPPRPYPPPTRPLPTRPCSQTGWGSRSGRWRLCSRLLHQPPRKAAGGAAAHAVGVVCMRDAMRTRPHVPRETVREPQPRGHGERACAPCPALVCILYLG